MFRVGNLRAVDRSAGLASENNSLAMDIVDLAARNVCLTMTVHRYCRSARSTEYAFGDLRARTAHSDAMNPAIRDASALDLSDGALDDGDGVVGGIVELAVLHDPG
jgi:hypothetical protein